MATQDLHYDTALDPNAPDVRVAVPLWRLYLLRGAYLLIVLGLGRMILPGVLHHGTVSLDDGVISSLLTGVWTLALLGLRYPLQMLPLLLFETVWKTIWLVSFGWPAWSSGQVDAATHETIKACLMGVVIFPAVIPWRHVFDHYVRRRGDRWH